LALDEILGRFEEVKEETEEEGKELRGSGWNLVVRRLTYRWGDEEGASPFVEVLLVSQIVRALSETAELLKASPELHSLLAKHLKEYSGEMESGVREIAAKLEREESRTPVLDLDQMRIVAKHIYPIDTASLIDYEIRKARALLERIRSSGPESGSSEEQ